MVTDERGPIELEDGSIYVGQWNSVKKEGKGKRMWQDGKSYEGWWKNDKANGKGRMI